MSKLRVKICGMRDPENIALIAECSPDYMGFIFVPGSLRFVGNLLSPAVTRVLPAEITAVGVFQNQELSDVVSLTTAYALRGVQLHGDEDARYCQELRRALPRVQLLKAVSVRSVTDVTNQSKLTGVDAIVFDNGKGGSGESFNWAFLAEYRGTIPFLVAGGVGTDNIVSLRTKREEWPGFIGVDASSRVEESPGIKSATKVRALIAKASGYGTDK